MRSYRFSPPVQHNGFRAYDLHRHADDIFGAPSWHAIPAATIHVSDSDGSARVIAPGVPRGLVADDLTHAVAFLRAILGATDIEATP